MCGRYGRRGDKQHIAEHYAIRRHDYDSEEHPYAFAPDYNITPGTKQPVVRLNAETDEREFAMLEWGIVPNWANKSEKAKRPPMLSNCARHDKLKVSWKNQFERNRCLIPVEFFYEWEKRTPAEIRKNITRPWAIDFKDQRLFSLACIWDTWKDRETGERLETYAVITTEPNEVLSPFHDRCPLILDPRDYSRWLTPYESENPRSVPWELVKSYPGDEMRAWRVNPLPPRANGPELLEPARVVEAPRLF
jgi:putative SOS response-associated peptidase YedK